MNKKRDPCNASNYRPKAIITIFGKVFEKVLKFRIVKYMEENSLLNTSQFGFRQGMNTTMAINSLCERITSNFENKFDMAYVLLDQSNFVFYLIYCLLGFITLILII